MAGKAVVPLSPSQPTEDFWEQVIFQELQQGRDINQEIVNVVLEETSDATAESLAAAIELSDGLSKARTRYSAARQEGKAIARTDHPPHFDYINELEAKFGLIAKSNQQEPCTGNSFQEYGQFGQEVVSQHDAFADQSTLSASQTGSDCPNESSLTENDLFTSFIDQTMVDDEEPWLEATPSHNVFSPSVAELENNSYTALLDDSYDPRIREETPNVGDTTEVLHRTPQEKASQSIKECSAFGNVYTSPSLTDEREDHLLLEAQTTKLLNPPLGFVERKLDKNSPSAPGRELTKVSEEPQKNLRGNLGPGDEQHERLKAAPLVGEEEYFKDISSILSVQPYRIGPDPKKLCLKCLHVGHNQDNKNECPARRLCQYLSGTDNPYTIYVSEQVRAIIITDINSCATGLGFAITATKLGVSASFGLTFQAILELQNLLKVIKEKGDRGEMGDVFNNGAEIIVGCKETLTAYPDRELVKIKTLSTPPLAAKFMLPGDMIHSSSSRSPLTPKEKDTAECERLELDVIGHRTNTICSKCYHRGHAKTASKICPVSLLESVVGKGTIRARNKVPCAEASRRISKLIDGLAPNDQRLSSLQKLVTEYRELFEQFSAENETLNQLTRKADVSCAEFAETAALGVESPDSRTIEAEHLAETHTETIQAKHTETTQAETSGRLGSVEPLFNVVEEIRAVCTPQSTSPTDCRIDTSVTSGLVELYGSRKRYLADHPDEGKLNDQAINKRRRSDSSHYTFPLSPKSPDFLYQSFQGDSYCSKEPQAMKLTSNTPLTEPRESLKILEINSPTVQQAQTYLDPTNLPQPLLVQLVPYIIPSINPHDYLNVNYMVMPKELLLSIFPYMVATHNNQRKSAF